MREPGSSAALDETPASAGHGAVVAVAVVGSLLLCCVYGLALSRRYRRRNNKTTSRVQLRPGQPRVVFAPAYHQGHGRGPPLLIGSTSYHQKPDDLPLRLPPTMDDTMGTWMGPHIPPPGSYGRKTVIMSRV